jgi:hypothetical protein
MSRSQLEKLRDEKRAELKVIEELLARLPSETSSRTTFSKHPRTTTREPVRTTTHKTFKPPPSGKTWFDWMRSTVQSSGKDMLLATLGGLAAKNGFVLDEGVKLSAFVSRVYGLTLYMSDEEHPRMFVTATDGHSFQTPTTPETAKTATDACVDQVLQSAFENKTDE